MIEWLSIIRTQLHRNYADLSLENADSNSLSTLTHICFNNAEHETKVYEKCLNTITI